MKLSVSSYSYHRLMGGGFTILDAVRHAAATGFDGIEIAHLDPETGVGAFALAREIRALCRELGIGLSNYCAAADFLHGRGGPPEDEAARVMRVVDLAAELGTPTFRHDAFWSTEGIADWQAGVGRVAAGIREVTRYAAGLGIRTMCENHGRVMQDSERMEYLVRAVDDENFGLLCDMGNFACVDEDSLAAVERVMPYTFYIHAKDFFKRQGKVSEDGWSDTRGGNSLCRTVVGRGDIPVRECIGLARRAGYDGWVSLEFEGREEPLAAIEEGYRFLRSVI